MTGKVNGAFTVGEALRMLSLRRLLWPLGFVLLSGCGFAVRHQLDQEIRNLCIENDDGLAPTGLVKSLPPPPQSVQNGIPSFSSSTSGGAATVRERFVSDRSLTVAAPKEDAAPKGDAAPLASAEGEVQRVVFEQEGKETSVKKRLFIPPGLPGADAPDIIIPKDPKERESYFDHLYPPVPELPPMPPPAPGPEGRPMTLADLQRLAEIYNPKIKDAYAAVEAAKGAAYQAGMYPNPSIAWEHDTVETGPAGYPGGFYDQLIKTGGKLTVQQAAATMDVLSARLKLRRARADLWTQVRSNYFAILVALQGVHYYEALFKFAEYLYEYQIKQLRVAKLGAGYQPMQLRPLVLQARFDNIQARNKYAASWRQLAATLGLPKMPPSQLAGSIDLPIPVYEYNNVVERMIRNHTDVRDALVSVQKAKYKLRLAKLVPLPDIGARALVQKDYTTPPNQVAHSAVMYMTVPLWDQNRGGIREAEWLLAQAAVGPGQAQLALINTLADAYNRYVVSRQQVDITMQQMRDLVRAYKGAWLQNQLHPDMVSFSDLWPVQVTLESYVNVYITALAAQWQATVDVADLLQTEDFFNSGQRQDIVPLPLLDDLMTPLRKYPRAPIARGRGGRSSGNSQAQGAAAPRLGVCANNVAPEATAKEGAKPQPIPEPAAPENPPAVLPPPALVPKGADGPAPEP